MSSRYLNITYLTTPNEDSTYLQYLPFADSGVFYSKIIKAECLTTGVDVKKVYDIALNVEDISHQFKPGDTIGILPENDDDEVTHIFERLDLTEFSNKSYVLSIMENTTRKKAAVPSHIPISSTLKILFTKYLNIRSVPKKLFLRALSDYTTDPEEIKIFGMLCQPKSSEYEKFVSSDGKTLLSILNAFPHCQPPIACLLEHLPALQPRSYSIASSPLLKNVLHIAFSVIENENIKGVCSSWLEQLSIKLSPIEIPFYFRKSSTFLLFENIKSPIIMIGPGTGVAPFIGLLQERFLNNAKDYGPSTLFFGCRTKDDFLYKNTLEKYVDCKILTNLIVAFSRESEKKVYVQDKIKERSKMLVEQILNEDAYVCVCGDAKNMEKDVEKVIVECITNYGNLTIDEAMSYVKELKKINRYQTDIWN